MLRCSWFHQEESGMILFMAVVCTQSSQQMTTLNLWTLFSYDFFLSPAWRYSAINSWEVKSLKYLLPRMMRWEQKKSWFIAGLTDWSWPVSCARVLFEQHAGVALSALIRGLDQLGMVAIVRYAYDRRSNPQVGAAFPFIKQHYEVRSHTPTCAGDLLYQCHMELS